MAARGEAVGDIYVRSHVDGRGMDRQLARTLERTEPVAKRSGESAGRSWGDGFAKHAEMRVSRTRRRMFGTMIRDAAITANRNARIFETNFFRKIEENIRDSFSGLSTVPEKMIEDLKRSVEQSGLDIDYFSPKAGSKEKAEAEIDQFLRGLRGKVRTYYEESHRDYESSYQRLVNATKRMQSGESNFGESFSRSMVRTRSHLRDLRVELDRLDFDEARLQGFQRGLRDMDRELFRINPRVRIFQRNLDRLSSRIGRAFGRGSRNDFIHFFGILTEGMFRLATFPAKMANIPITIAKIGIEAVEAARGVSGFTKSLAAGAGAAIARVAPMLASAAGGAAAMGAGMILLVPILGIVSSLVVGLVAALTALAGTISLALIGGIAALAGSLLPVTAGIGVLVAAIYSLSDAQKKALKTAIKPFTDGMKEIGRVAADTLFGGEQFTKTINNMSKALTSSNMRNLVRSISRAIGNVGSSWAKSLNSPGFRAWLKAMDKTLPGQIETLGSIGENFGKTMGNVFLAMQPMIDRFLGWLDRVTEGWARMSATADGQRGLQEFFQRVGDAGKAVVDVMGAIKDALGSLFEAGNDSGISMLESLANKFRELNSYVTENPEAVREWFENGVEVAQKVGNAIMGIVDAISALDTPETRRMLSEIFTAMTWSIENLVIPAIDGISWVIRNVVVPSVVVIGKVFGEVFGHIAYVIGGILDAVGAVVGALAAIPGSPIPDDWGKNVDKASDKMYDFGKTLTDQDWTIDLEVNDDGSIGEVKTKLGELAQTPPIDVGVKVSDIGAVLEAAAIAAEIKETLRGAGGVEITDNGTNKTLQELLLGTSQQLRSIPRSTDAKVTDSGTNRSLQSLLKTTDGLIDDVKGTHKSKVKGEVFPSNFLSTLRNIGSQLAGIAGTTRTRVSGGRTTASMAGNIFTSPGLSSFAEDYKAEAIVPLERPLHLVNPEVRDIAAFAQGKYKGDGEGGTGQVIDASGWTIVSNSEDAHTVANEVLNEIVGKLL